MYKRVVINNTKPRRDMNGNILDAHGGPLFNKFGDRFYNYGVHYGKTDGYSKEIHFACYSSRDLENWKYEGSLFDGKQDPGFYFRPHVVFHQKSGKYIMWFLRYDEYLAGNPNQCIKGNAVADSPTGPFSVVNSNVELSCELSGDHDLFVDDDGTCYLVHSHHDFSKEKGKATIRVERLNDDYVSSSKEFVVLDSEGIPCEAPAMFKRNGMYYCMFDKWCDRLKWGSGARVYTAADPMGPWTYRGNPNRNEKDEFIVWAQQNTVAPVETATGTEYLWAGDRWRTADYLGWDFQYWHKLEFEEDGSIKKFNFEKEWEINLKID